MKKVNTSLIIIFLIVIGFTSCKQSDAPGDGLIKVDILTTNYPKKELILQDFMDVEYIALETNDNFINQGFVQAVGEKIILVTNRNRDGDIFVYERTGKALRKINRQGGSEEEYTRIFNITLDENRGEIFVSDIFKRKIFVYDLYGNFKRNFNHKDGVKYISYADIFNYDKDHLICYDEYNKEVPFVLLSKQDGSITKEIKISFKEKKILEQTMENGNVTVGPGFYHSIVSFRDNWILSEVSSDTVYTFLSDYSLHPFLVRTPSIQSTYPEVFLILRLFSDRYIFMETVKNVYNWETKKGFPRTFFMYDKLEKDFGGYTVYNGDYSTKKEIYMNRLRPVNHEIESWQPLEAYQLVKDYNEGRLKGKLKEIASTLKEDDNPVIMLIKHKK